MHWDVLRQDDNGNEFLMSSHDSRIAALTQTLVMESGVQHKQMYRVSGPAGGMYRTNRDLYLHFLHLGQQARSASWSLSAFLRSLWKVSRPLRDRPGLEPDDVAAMFSAAAATSPIPFDPAWLTRDLALPGHEPSGYQDWERVIFSQIADLEDFRTHAPAARGRFGMEAPRPPGSGRRATPARWLNFDLATYLECAVAGSLGGWDAMPNGASPLDALPTNRPYVHDLTVMCWSDLAHIAICGQVYE